MIVSDKGIDLRFYIILPLISFSPSEEERPQEDMVELLHKSLHLGPSLDVTTGACFLMTVIQIFSCIDISIWFPSY